jgi:hypothetical protein
MRGKNARRRAKIVVVIKDVVFVAVGVRPTAINDGIRQRRYIIGEGNQFCGFV